MERIQVMLHHLDSYAEQSTLLKFVWLNEQIENLSNQIGFAPDQLKYLFCLLAAYPFAALYSFLPSSKLKHLYSFLVGFSFAQFVLGSGWIHSFITATFSFALVKFCSPKHAPFAVFIFNMIYLSTSHIYRIYTDYMGWTLDFTGPQMILVIKLTSFAYNYYDGAEDYERINGLTLQKQQKQQQQKVDSTEQKVDSAKDKALSKVYASRKRYAIHQLPSLIEFYGYVYCFNNFLAGPAFEIKTYLETMEGKNVQLHQHSSSRYKEAIKKLIIGLINLALFTLGVAHFPLDALYHSSMTNHSFLQRIAIAWITMFIVRTKYYFAWKVAEGATVLGGFGLEGFHPDGSVIGWNGVSNMDILGFEFAQSIREASRAWNKGTQAWLERYVYSRTGNSLVATYFCSAFWHGFYPGYYFFFMSVPLATAINRLAYKKLRPWFIEKDGSFGSKKKAYDIISMCATSLCLNYLVLSFQVLAMEYSILVWKYYYFSGHIVLLISYVIFSSIPVRKIKKEE